ILPAGAATASGQSASGMGMAFTAIAVGLAAAALYGLYRVVERGSETQPVRLSLSGESVGLGALVLFLASVLTFSWPHDKGSAALSGELGEASGIETTLVVPKPVDSRILFETTDFDEVLSSVAVSGDRLVLGTGRQSGFQMSGAVLCLDRASGKECWQF